jgi:hypothetical protein
MAMAKKPRYSGLRAAHDLRACFFGLRSLASGLRENKHSGFLYLMSDHHHMSFDHETQTLLLLFFFSL